MNVDIWLKLSNPFLSVPKLNSSFTLTDERQCTYGRVREHTRACMRVHIIWQPRVLVVHVYMYDDVIKWKHFPRYCYWPFSAFVRGIHRSSLNSLHKDQWRGALMFSVICAWINGWVNNRKTGDLRRHHHAHYDVIVMAYNFFPQSAKHGTRISCEHIQLVAAAKSLNREPKSS